MVLIEALKQGISLLGVPSIGLFAFLQDFANRSALEEFDHIFGLGKSARNPNKISIFLAENRAKFQSDTHANLHDFGSCRQLFDRCRIDRVVINHRQTANAFDPGIHNQVRRILAALRIGVVHVLVHRELIPTLGHFE